MWIPKILYLWIGWRRPLSSFQVFHVWQRDASDSKQSLQTTVTTLIFLGNMRMHLRWSYIFFSEIFFPVKFSSLMTFASAPLSRWNTIGWLTALIFNRELLATFPLSATPILTEPTFFLSSALFCLRLHSCTASHWRSKCPFLSHLWYCVDLCLKFWWLWPVPPHRQHFQVKLFFRSLGSLLYYFYHGCSLFVLSVLNSIDFSGQWCNKLLIIFFLCDSGFSHRD